MGDAAYKYIQRPGRQGHVFEIGRNIKNPKIVAGNIQEAKKRRIAEDAMATAI